MDAELRKLLEAHVDEAFDRLVHLMRNASKEDVRAQAAELVRWAMGAREYRHRKQ